MKKRIFNYRPMCFVAFFVMIGIIIGEALYPFNRLFRLIPAVLSLSVVIGLFSFSRTRRFAYIAIAFLAGLIAMCGANDVYDSRRIEGGYTAIQCTVDSEITVEDGTMAFYVKDVIYDGKALKGRAYVNMEGEDRPDFGAGDVINVFGNLEFKEHQWFDTFYSVAVNKSTYYNMWGKSAYKLADGKADFPLNLQLDVKRMFYENTDGDTAMICQALVLGDKFGIDDNLYDGIKASGLAHVLAVSGLHVTALASALFFLLKRTRLKPLISLGIVAVITFLYSMLCGFTASSLRALIMTVVLNFGTAMGYKYDKLSSLSLASTVIMIVRPQSVMDAGFLLSVFSVLGIFTYHSTFKSVFTKVSDKLSLDDKFNSGSKASKGLKRAFVKGWDRLGDSISVSLSANMMTMPLVGYFFKSVPVLFIVSNLIILPYLMFIYIILLVITVFCQLTSLWGVSIVMQFLLIPFRLWTDFVGSLSWVNMSFEVSCFFVLAWLTSAIFSSKYVFLRRRTKLAFVVFWLATLSAIVTTAILTSA